MTKARTYPRRGLHGAVVHDIGVRIVRGELGAGNVLPNEDELSGELTVSRTVLREAIKVLAAKRLVESRPKTGTRVLARREWNLLDPDVLAWLLEAGPDREFLTQAMELRQLIEPPALRLAAARATDEQIAALQDAHHQMELVGEDLEAFMEPDLRFHSILLEACHNELLEHLSPVIASVLRTLFSYPERPPGAFKRSAEMHGAIVNAIRGRDPDGAEAALVALTAQTAKDIEWSIDRGWGR